MTRNRAFLILSALLAALTLAAVGCGSSSDSSSASDDTTQETETVETDTTDTDTTDTDTTETDTTETGTTETESQSGDTGAVPPPGEATVEVDGKTFVFFAKDTISERLLKCEVSEEMVTINFQTDGYDDITIQARPVDGVWLGSITAVPEDAAGTYGINSLDEVTIDGQSAVFKGPFTFSPDENRADFQEVGEGRVAVTCS